MKLYVIAGLSRVGKSILTEEIKKQKQPIVISTDRVRSAIRYVLMGDAPGGIEKVNFKTDATYRIPKDSNLQKFHFERNDLGEDDYAWLGVENLIKGYDRENTSDILVEGVAVNPLRIHELKLNNLDVRAVFIGYGKESHADSILAYSREKQDWVFREMERTGSGEEYVRNWMTTGIPQSAELKKQAKEFGYGYFDVTERLFPEHTQAVIDYLLKD